MAEMKCHAKPEEQIESSDKGEQEAAFVDVRKGSKASVKVEFRVVGLELTEEELKAVGDAFDQQEAEEAAVNRAAMEEELKKAALKAVKEKMRSAAPVTMVEAEEEKKT